MVDKIKESGKIKLRDYQITAIDNWTKSNHHGIFNMATGTGKTITAVKAMMTLYDSIGEKMITIVATPFQHLIEEPWYETLKKELDATDKNIQIVRAYGGYKKWVSSAKNCIEQYCYELIDSIIFITTYDTLCSNNFIEIIRDIKSKKLLIADEMHNSGSEVFRNGLLDEYNYRLGLSATPARYLDEDGTEYIQNYFGGEVYEFSLSRAINEINPGTGETYLTPYRYKPVFVSLNHMELESYADYTRRLAKYVGRDDLTPNDMKHYTSLLINRSRIVKNAESKFIKLFEMIPQLKNEGFMDKCLIYCSDGKDPADSNIRSMSRIIQCLNEHNIECRRFSASEDIEERKDILKRFSDGRTKTLVAIKCLDEGVDVPATKNAIIIASTGNAREYIQRRGRILRRSPGKTFATIIDFVVVPDLKEGYVETSSLILENEFNRVREFAVNSMNFGENKPIIDKILEENKMELRW